MSTARWRQLGPPVVTPRAEPEHGIDLASPERHAARIRREVEAVHHRPPAPSGASGRTMTMTPAGPSWRSGLALTDRPPAPAALPVQRALAPDLVSRQADSHAGGHTHPAGPATTPTQAAAGSFCLDINTDTDTGNGNGNGGGGGGVIPTIADQGWRLGDVIVGSGGLDGAAGSDTTTEQRFNSVIVPVERLRQHRAHQRAAQRQRVARAGIDAQPGAAPNPLAPARKQADDGNDGAHGPGSTPPPEIVHREPLAVSFRRAQAGDVRCV